MSDLISRSALIKELIEEADTRFAGLNGCVSLGEMKEWVENQPTVEANPVVHGKWENGMKCSQCGQIDWTKPNFCPKCGARMVKDNE